MSARFIILILMGYTLTTKSQDLIFKNYGLEQGFPSSEAHAIYQDYKGYMWFATDKGLARFDGKNFLTLTPENGLPELCFFNFFEESPTKVWIAGKSNRLYCFNPTGSLRYFYEYPLNDELVKQFNKLPISFFIRIAKFDAREGLLISFLRSCGYIQVDLMGHGFLKKRRSYYSDISYENNHILIDLSEPPGTEFIHTTLVSKKPGEKKTWILIKDPAYPADTLNTGIDFLLKARFHPGVSEYHYLNDSWHMILGRYMIQYGPQRQVSWIELPAEGLHFELIGDEIFVATFEGCYRYNASHQLIGSYLTNTIVTDVYADDDGGIWLTTTQDGMYYTKSHNFYTYRSTQENKVVAEALIADSTWIFCATENKNALVYNRKGELIESFDRTSRNNGFYISYSRRGLEKYLGTARKSLSHKSGWVYKDNAKTDTCWTEITGKGFQYYGVNEIKIKEVEIPFMNAGYYPKNDSALVIATDEGLYRVYNYSEISPVVSARKYSNVAMLDVMEFQMGHLISTRYEGLIYLDEKRDVHLTKRDGLISNTITDLLKIDDSTIWAATPVGLMRLQWHPAVRRISMNVIDHADGLLRGEVQVINYFRDTLWAGTKRGIFFFPDKPEIYQSTLNPDHFSIDSVKVNDKKWNQPVDTIEVDYGDFTEFFFTQVSFRQDGLVTYEYRFNNDSTWKSLPTGSYLNTCKDAGYSKIYIRPKGANFEQVVVIYTRNPIWYEWWFYALVFVVIALIYWITSNMVTRRINAKKTDEIEKLKLEMRALLSQMNPHFTFNTMNSIQSYIIAHNTREAVLYLSDFALMIRKTLNYSRVDFITLEEEIAFLNIYLNLEKKRFKNNMNLTIQLEVTQQVSNIKLPPLMLQPIVENSVIHGLRNVDDGIISMTVTEKPGFFEFRLCDNGHPVEIQTLVSVNKTSVGMEILRDRVRLHNGKFYQPTDFQQGYGLVENMSGWCTVIRLYKLS